MHSSFNKTPPRLQVLPNLRFGTAIHHGEHPRDFALIDWFKDLQACAKFELATIISGVC